MENRYKKRKSDDPYVRSFRIKDVKQMHDLHHNIKRRLFLGQTNIDIAKTLGVTPQMVSYVKNSAPVKAEIALMRGAADADVVDLAVQINELAPKAFENVKSVIEEGQVNGEAVPVKMIIDESNKVLDRSIGKPAQKIAINQKVTHLTADDIEKLKKRAIALGIDRGMINVTPEQVEEVKELEAQEA